MKKNKIFNMIMVVLIAVILCAGIMIVINVRGNRQTAKADSVDPGVIKQDIVSEESTTEETPVSEPGVSVVGEIQGIADIERSGIGYELSNGMELRAGDILETKNGASLKVTSGKNFIVMNENSLITVDCADSKQLAVTVDEGEIYATLDEGSSLQFVKFGNLILEDRGTVFSVDARTGSATVQVYEGSVTVGDLTAAAGQRILFTGDKGEIIAFTPEDMNAFELAQSVNAAGTRTLCFTTDEMSRVIADREEASRKAAEEAATEQTTAAAGGNSSGSGKTAGSAGGTGNGSGSGSGGGTGESGSGGSGSGTGTCTIYIECSSILSHMGNLTPGKNIYVPASGVILGTSTVEFAEGETVYDVLKTVTDCAGIQMEAAYTPVYGGYYIEGIGNLYEFDCGDMSGWTYTVNGWYPNYGCSQYKLKNGDTIVWSFTCG